jgi:hypothetical protein
MESQVQDTPLRSGFLPDYVIVDESDPTGWIVDYGARHPHVSTRALLGSLLTFGDGLALRPSTIAGAGLGVFLTRPVKKGAVITGYEGAILFVKEVVILLAASGDRSDLTTHLFKMNDFWQVAANFRRLPQPNRFADDLYEKLVGLVPIRDPLEELQGHHLGGYMNTLFERDRAAGARSFNVRFEMFYDAAIASIDTRNVQEYLKALAYKKTNQAAVALALRDLEAGEELFVDYGPFKRHDKEKKQK